MIGNEPYTWRLSFLVILHERHTNQLELIALLDATNEQTNNHTQLRYVHLADDSEFVVVASRRAFQ